MELHLKVDSKFIKNIQRTLGLEDSTEVVKHALAVLNWVSDNVKVDRPIITIGKDGKIYCLDAPWSIKIPDGLNIELIKKEII